MGLYDRPYYRDEDAPSVFSGQRSVVTTLILINVAVFVVDFFSGGVLSKHLAVSSDLLTHPWNLWTLLTAGFLHDPHNLTHILFNMYGLWLFGTEVELTYGRREFIWLYLSLIVLASLTWVMSVTITQGLSSPLGPEHMIGASGAVTGIMVIFGCHFPHRTFSLLGIVPMPAWILIGAFILFDFLGAMRGDVRGGNVAYMAHLGGAVFGYLYFRSGQRLSSWFDFRGVRRLFSSRPKLKLHRGEDEKDLNVRVDKILEKISREGEASLTRSERQLLETASRRYQQRRS